MTTGGLLMFGKADAIRRFVPTHEAAFQVLRGLDVEINDFLPYPLLRLGGEMLSRFRARNSEEEISFGLLRVGVSAYSETAFREALANALVHRDYTRRGAVHVQRSPLIADAFKRAGLVERTGRGVNRMFAEQLRVGRLALTTAGPHPTTSSPSCPAAPRTCL